MQAEDYAQAGYDLLNEQLPDWRQYIDIDTLQMSDPRLCVAGQLGSNHPRFADNNARLWKPYTVLVDSLGIAPYAAQVAHGFDAYGSYNMQCLQDAWIGLLTA